MVHRFSWPIGVITEDAYTDFAERNFPKAQMVKTCSWDNAMEVRLNGRVGARYAMTKEIHEFLPEMVAAHSA